jgi:hypothetical protein
MFSFTAVRGSRLSQWLVLPLGFSWPMSGSAHGSPRFRVATPSRPWIIVRRQRIAGRRPLRLIQKID